MTAFALEANWADAAVHDRPELQATYASFTIRIGDNVVTDVRHRNSQTTSDSVFVSLYPLAEWIAGNWWVLTEEAEVPGRNGYLERHSLRSGRAGYCLPDLCVKSEGETFLLEWRPIRYTHAPIEFTAGGCVRLSRDEVVGTLREFVENVRLRLTRRGITNTWLHQEWDAIQTASADPEQLEYCRTAAWLGQDAFDPSSIAPEELEALRDLPAQVFEDVLRAAGFSDVADIAAWTKAQLGDSQDGATMKSEIAGRKDAKARSSVRPWTTGYDLANNLRSGITNLGEVPVKLEALFEGEPLVTPRGSVPAAVDGLTRDNGTFACYTEKRRLESRRFVLARALFDHLTCTHAASLLTAAHTSRQSQGRAFAAELLAPADLLRQRIASAWVSDEQLSELAEELQISEWVLIHQIRNHRIAELPPEPAPRP